MFPENKPSKKIDPFLRAIGKKQFCTFYLTGSRFFGTHKSDSDWDFFVQDTKEAKEFLRGWSNSGRPLKQLVELQTYKDRMTSEVWRWQMNGTQVDIQVVSSAFLKNKTQTWLLSTGYYHEMYSLIPKKQRYLIWDLALAASRGIDTTTRVDRHPEPRAVGDYPVL